MHTDDRRSPDDAHEDLAPLLRPLDAGGVQPGGSGLPGSLTDPLPLARPRRAPLAAGPSPCPRRPLGSTGESPAAAVLVRRRGPAPAARATGRRRTGLPRPRRARRGTRAGAAKPAVRLAGDGFANATPAAVLDEDLLGCKWVTLVPDNPAHGLPTAQGVMILSDAGTAATRALMGAASLTAQRTAAVSGACPTGGSSARTSVSRRPTSSSRHTSPTWPRSRGSARCSPADRADPRGRRVCTRANLPPGHAPWWDGEQHPTTKEARP